MSNPKFNQTTVLHPIAQAIRLHKGMACGSLLLASSLLGAPAFADLALEEVIVTAQKRSENLQDVPISLQALDATKIREMGIGSFDDYAAQLPSLTYKTNGPGLGAIYMRGVSDGGDGLQSGASPSVGIYLDEQSVTSVALNMDIHIYDIKTIEALAGPQGTLYGASSQSGTLRIITNKPVIGEYEGRVDVGGFFTEDGALSNSQEAMVNIPIGDKAALRIVGWHIDEGGYIDNVAGTRTYNLSGIYGYGLTTGRTGTIDNRTYDPNDGRVNAQRPEEDFNELEKIGARAALKVDFNDDWSATAGFFIQSMNTTGVWDHRPDFLNPDGNPIGDLNTVKFFEDQYRDEFKQYSLLLEGKIANHDVTYSGTFLDRTVDYVNDYTDYGIIQSFVPFNVCDYSATGSVAAGFNANTDCTSLEEFVDEEQDMERQTHELRFRSLHDGPINYTVGFFWNKFENDFQLNFLQPSMAPSRYIDHPKFGGAEGFNSFFVSANEERVDKQIAVFGEITYDFNEQFSATLGGRWYEVDNSHQGLVQFNTSPAGFTRVGSDLPEETLKEDDTLYKVNLTYRHNEDVMVYFTTATGYRPSGINQDRGALPADLVTYDSDLVTNYEIGWKTTWMDGRLRANGAIYRTDWEDTLFTLYEFSLSACCGNTYNLGDVEITGAELDLTFAASEALTLSVTLAYTDAATTEPFTFFVPVSKGNIPEGKRQPNVPDWKGSMTARYEFPLAAYDAFAQVNITFQSDSDNRARPGDNLFAKQSGYSITNLRAGLSMGSWNVDVFLNNVFNKRADISVNQRVYDTSTVINRPRSFGMKVGYSFF